MLPLIFAAYDRLSRRLRLWLRHEQTKARLTELDERMLKDVGLTPLDALIEAARRFRDTKPGRGPKG